MSDSKWSPVTRQQAPGVALGMEPIPNKLASLTDALWNGDFAVASGPSKDSRIFVAPTRNSDDTFAWLNAFASETFPISQFVRLVTEEDEDLLEGLQAGTIPLNLPMVGVILGEILAQRELPFDLETLPVSRAVACFSFAAAKANALFPDTSACLRRCTERLREIERDEAFSKRPISVDQLVNIWFFAMNPSSTDFLSPEDAARSVVSTMSEMEPAGVLPWELRNLSIFEGKASLVNESAEGRVRAFDEVTGRVSPFLQTTGFSGQYSACVLAAAAFLVGQGTSHISLLKPFSARSPLLLPYFGLFAGLCGPKSWTPVWTRNVKGVEKYFRASYSLFDVPTVDLCWPEYHWMRSTFDGPDVFENIPKLQPKTLSIEIVPGASCQLRLGQATTVSRGPRAAEGESGVGGGTLENLPELRSIAARLNTLLGVPRPASPPQQPPLFVELPPAKPRRSTKPKKQKP